MSNARQGAAQGAQQAQAQPQQPRQTVVQTKLCLLGEAATGKSSIVLRFVSNEFQENKEPTIGAAFLTQKCRLDSAIIKFEIWDTAGQERFHSLAPMYYRNAQASAVVYDITRASSFEKAKSWVKELQRQANPSIVIALVGNKLDLVAGEGASKAKARSEDSEQDDDDDNDEAETVTEGGQSSAATSSARAVPTDEAKAYADEAGLLFFETSAKTGEGVIELFTEIAKKIPVEQIAAQQQARSGQTAGAAGNNQQGGAGRGGLNLSAPGGANRDACNC